MLQFIIDHYPLILSALLVISESSAAVAQMLFPQNLGVSGFLAGIIKFLQALGVKEPK